MTDEKLVGSLNLAKLTNVGIMTIKGQSCNKKCVVIPIEDNDIYVKVEEKRTGRATGMLTASSASVSRFMSLERKTNTETRTTWCSSTSKEYINTHSQADLDLRNKIYLGNLHPVAIPSSNQAATVEAPPAEVVTSSDDDLPF